MVASLKLTPWQHTCGCAVHGFLCPWWLLALLSVPKQLEGGYYNRLLQRHVAGGGNFWSEPLRVLNCSPVEHPGKGRGPWCWLPGNSLLGQWLQLWKSGHLQQVAVHVTDLAGCITTPNLPALPGCNWRAVALALNVKWDEDRSTDEPCGFDCVRAKSAAEKVWFYTSPPTPVGSRAVGAPSKTKCISPRLCGGCGGK